MIVGVGVDLVDEVRFSRALDRTPGLVTRLFTPGERGRPVASLAARFAAKEAVAKALAAPGGLRWLDVEIRSGAAGRPHVHVTGTVRQAAGHLGVQRWHVSLSHDGGMAIAVVIAED